MALEQLEVQRDIKPVAISALDGGRLYICCAVCSAEAHPRDVPLR